MINDLFFLSLLTFLLILVPLVILHELGHLITALLFKVKVHEFGIGFPPKLFSLWTGNTTVLISDDVKNDIYKNDYIGKIITLEISDKTDEFITKSIKKADKEDFSIVLNNENLIIGKLKKITNKKLIISEMQWSINLLPIGGFVKMVGEESSQIKNSLGSKSHWKRLIVISSGALINLIIPFIIFPIIGMIPQQITKGKIMVNSVFPNSPAYEVGLKKGDLIDKIHDKEINTIQDLQLLVNSNLGKELKLEISSSIPNPFPRPDQMQYEYKPVRDEITLVPRWKPPQRKIVMSPSNINTEISLVEARKIDSRIGINNKLIVVSEVSDPNGEISLSYLEEIDKDFKIGDEIIITEFNENITSITLKEAQEYNPILGIDNYIQEGAMGIQISLTEEYETVKSLGLKNSIINGWEEIFNIIILTKNSIRSSFIGSNNPQFQGPATLGPIGISQVTGSIAKSEASINTKIISLLYISATISLSLGVINLLPIPALDGGRIFFVLLEIFRGGKRISASKEALVHFIGFTMLIGLIILISIQDIIRIFSGELLF